MISKCAQARHDYDELNPCSKQILLKRCLAAIGAWMLANGCLCAAEWQAAEGGRWHEVAVSGKQGGGFQLVGGEVSGVRFTNRCALQRHLTNQILLNGSGVAAGDVDGDGRCDLY